MTKEQVKALRLQRLIGAVFLSLGGWSLIAPGSVIALTVRHEHQSDSLLALVAMGAFGAQACIAGLFAMTARFTAATFLAYAVALMPFFVFDWWFYFVEPLFNALILLDVAGNAVMLALCIRGWGLLRRP